ncbi:MAG: SpoIIE family protein phosphatase [Bacilli bacterium]|nr:SpoIIE family protein phosphatase [Bacilli bacterium]
MEEYQNESLRKNEYDANRELVRISFLGGLFLFAIWLGYLFQLFPLRSYTLVHICMPIIIILLLSTIFWPRGKHFTHPKVKYMLLFNYMLGVLAINVIIPKHGILAWGLIIIMTNHYYNVKLGRFIFATSLVGMLIALYLGMFFGEYDINLFNGLVNYLDENGIIKAVEPATVQDRYNLLQDHLARGDNRYFKVFIFYYLARAYILTLIFLISQALNKRTYKLLNEEIDANSAKQKMETELKMASDIQLAALPPESLSDSRVEVLAELKAAREVGGDFYDYYYLDAKHLAIIIGDVSDKGSPAAMFMMKAITCFKNIASIEKSASEILTEVNKLLCQGNENSMFVTAFFGILDLDTGVLQYANAGHNAPVIGQNGLYHYLAVESGFLLGAVSTIEYTNQQTKLSKGDMIMLYTDGITEARNLSGEFFGEERLLNCFNNIKFDSMIELHHNIKDSIEEFVGDAIQTDDITFMTIKYQSDEIYIKELSVLADIAQITRLEDSLKESIKEYHLEALSEKLLTVLDETASNICKFAYTSFLGEIFYRFTYNKTKQEVSLTFIDKGIPFNQMAFENQMVDENYQNKPLGGLGIMLVKQIIDYHSYNRINNKNILVLKKKI